MRVRLLSAPTAMPAPPLARAPLPTTMLRTPPSTLMPPPFPWTVFATTTLRLEWSRPMPESLLPTAVTRRIRLRWE